MIVALREQTDIPCITVCCDRLRVFLRVVYGNDVNAIKNMGMLPEGYTINHLTDTDAFFIKTDAPNGFKYFEEFH